MKTAHLARLHAALGTAGLYARLRGNWLRGIYALAHTIGMTRKRKNVGGNNQNRRTRRLKGTGLAASESNTHTVNAQTNRELAFRRPKKHEDTESKQRVNDLLSFASFGLGCGSWAWSVISPESSIFFGSVLLLAAVIFTWLGVQRVWTFGKFWRAAVPVLLFGVFIAFDWFVVVKPQRGKAFQDLLVEGYHLTNECEAIPGDTQMPTWMRDQSKGWQSRVQQLIGARLSPADAQTWQQAIVIGTIKDENTNAYQCLWLGTKVAALETIVATEFEPNLRHRDKVGATYWLNAVNGEVDMSEVFKSGNRDARIFINGGGKNNPSGMITVKGHDLPVKSGTINFQPEILP